MTQVATQLVIDSQALATRQQELPPLPEEDVRIQVLFSAISHNDVLLLQGKHKNDYFGTGVVGKVTAVGSKVGHTQVGEIVGVFHDNTNLGDHTTGFTSYRQVHQHEIFSIPTAIEPEQAAAILATGVTAFNAVSVAVVGTGSLAYLVTQYATKSGLQVTVFGYEGDEQLGKEWEVGRFVVLSNESIQKEAEKYQAVIITDIIKQADTVNISGLAARNGSIYVAIDMGYNPNVAVLDLICSQKSFVGVKRGNYGQAVKALHAAVFKGVRAQVQVFESNEYAAAFERAKGNPSASIVLKY